MARKRENYDNEIVNLRAFYLRLLQKLWIVVVAAAAGAVLGGVIYFLAHVVYGPAREYVTTSTVYIDFAYDEKKGSEVDYYNAYTWNIVLGTDDVLNEVMSNLEASGISETNLSRQQVLECINADIPSDVRVMLLTVKNKDKDLCTALTSAVDDALVTFGRTNEAFEQIKILGVTDAELEVVTDKTATAVCLGAVIGIILSVLWLLILESMNDIIYVPEDAEKRYNLPVIGIMTSKGQEEPSFYRNELLVFFQNSDNSGKEFAVFSVDDKTGQKFAEDGTERLKDILGSELKKSGITLKPCAMPGNDPAVAEKIKNVEGAFIMASHCKRSGAMIQHMISMLNKLGCQTAGIVITDADKRFLKLYMGL